MATKPKTTEELMQDRLAELQADLAAFDETNAPLRKQMDDIHDQQNALAEQLAPLAQQWIPLQEERQLKQNEIGRLARALGGKSTSDNRD